VCSVWTRVFIHVNIAVCPAYCFFFKFFLFALHLLPPMLRNNVAGMNCRMILILALVGQLGEKTVRNLLPLILLVHSFVDPHFAVCGYRYHLWKAFSFRPVYSATFLVYDHMAVKLCPVQLPHKIKK
jgi:hypothetical protein